MNAFAIIAQATGNLRVEEQNKTSPDNLHVAEK
jgi:hypothetical protein